MTFDTQMHQALSSRTRQRILSVLRTADRPLDVQRLAGLVDLRANSVRSHLTVLEGAGLVSSAPEERDRPGRPRLVYTATDRDHDDGALRGYRLLAGVLAGYLADTAADPAGAGERAGTVWGRYLVDGPAPFQSVPPEDTIAQIVALLDELGFEPELDSDASATRVLLRHCPFVDVATEHQQVVCSLHLGLMRGALDELGGHVRARDLLPFVEPGLCVSHLEVPA